MTLPGQAATLIVSDRPEAGRLVEEHPGSQVRELRANIDRSDFRHRLWSVTDNPIRYYLENFSAARANEHRIMKRDFE